VQTYMKKQIYENIRVIVGGEVISKMGKLKI